MNYRIASPRLCSQVLAAVLTVALAGSFAPKAFAQTPPAKPAEKKPAAKPAADSDQKPQEGTPGLPQFMYEPWVKICGTNERLNNRKECATQRVGRLENGQPMVGALLVQADGQDSFLLRVMVPMGMSLQHGTRIVVDQNVKDSKTAEYRYCGGGGCWADFEVNKEFVNQLKKGKLLTVQARNLAAAALDLPLPLADFAKAFDGPPTDPKAFEAQQRKLHEELQKRAEEARKKLESQQPAAPPTAEKKN